MSHSALRVALVAALVVLAGCNGLLGAFTESEAGQQEAATETTTAGNATTATATTRPETAQAVYESLVGSVDARAVADGHVEALAGRSFVTTQTTVLRDGSGTVVARSEVATRVGTDHERFHRNHTLTGDRSLFLDPASFVLQRAYSNGTTTVACGRPDGTTQCVRWSEDTALVSARDSERWSTVFRLFAGVNTTLDGVVERNDTRLYRVTSTDGPHEYGGENVTEVSLVAFVDRQGVVREYRLGYDDVRDGREVRVEQTVVYEAVGETAVERPGWVDDVPERTTGNGTTTDG